MKKVLSLLTSMCVLFSLFGSVVVFAADSTNYSTEAFVVGDVPSTAINNKDSWYNYMISDFRFGTNIAYAKVTNNSTTDSMKATLVIGFYKDDNLVKVQNSQTVTIPPVPATGTDNVYYFTETVNVASEDEGCVVKVFLWDSMGNMKPLMSSLIESIHAMSLPGLFTDNMVIQQNQPINFWGRAANSGDSITVTMRKYNGQDIASRTVTASTNIVDKYLWKATFDPMSYSDCSEPFKVIITGPKDNITLENVILGEVWLCSGQSNMEYQMDYSEFPDANADIPNMTNPNVRIIENNSSADLDGFLGRTDGWKQVTPATVKNFSALATYFGFKLQPQLNVPVGLVQSAKGGSSILWWYKNNITDKQGRTYIDAAAVKHLYRWDTQPYTTGPFGLAGILWYQGEANTADAAATQMRYSIDGSATNVAGTMPITSLYTKEMEQLVRDHRAAFGRDLPFLYVQLAQFNNATTDFTKVREQQLNFLKGVDLIGDPLDKLGMAVITDITSTGNNTSIHPKGKSQVADRLVLLARKIAYGENITASGPIYDQTEDTSVYKANDGTVYETKPEGVSVTEIPAITVHFNEDSLGTGLDIKGGVLKGVKIATASMANWVVPEWKISSDGKSLILWSEALPVKPSLVKYGYEAAPGDITIFNKDGLPASPFRNYDDSFTPISDPVPAMSMSVSNISPNSVTISWSPGGSGIIGYKIYRDNVQIADVGSMPYRDTTVAQNTTYKYKVSVYDSAGTEYEQSEEVSATTPSLVTAYCNFEDGTSSNMTLLDPNDSVVLNGSSAYNGVNCRQIPLNGSNLMTFDIPSSIISAAGTAAVVNVKYFDNAANATGIIKILDKSGNALHYISRKGSNKWMQDSFVVRNLPSDDTANKFELKITKNLGTDPEAYVSQISFAPLYSDASASFEFLAGQQQKGNLMRWTNPPATIDTVQGRSCGIFPNVANSVTYFNVNQDFMNDAGTGSGGASYPCPNITLKVTYFDGSGIPGTTPLWNFFITKYQKKDSTGAFNSVQLPNTPITNTNTWKTKVFYISDAGFNNTNSGQTASVMIVGTAFAFNKVEVIPGTVDVPGTIDFSGLRGTPSYSTRMDYVRSTNTADAYYTVQANNIGESTCQQIPAGSRMDIKIDDDYIASANNNVSISVTYYDYGTDTFNINYLTQNTINKIIPVKKTDSGTWKTIAIHLKDAKMNNSLNSSDFNISAAIDQPVYVRNIDVKKD